MNDVEVSIELYSAPGCFLGWTVQWYRPGEDGEGEVQSWFGTKAECEARAKLPPDPDCWEPLSGGDNGRDAATATGMYDRF
jgi:hypothetical protein